MLRLSSSLVLGAALLAGCTSTESILADPTFATGSRTLVASADHDDLFNVNVDEGTITRSDLASGTTEVLAVGEEPTRIARAGDRLFVTLRGERAVAVVHIGPAGMDLVDTIEVGAEPFGVVANEEGTVVYIAVSLENRVVAMDTSSLEIVGSWAIEGEPRWLALHPSGKTLVAASARGAGVYSINVEGDGDDAVDPVFIPVTERTTFDGVYTLVPRIMGDPAFDAQGVNLAIPALYVDNQSQQDVPTGVDPTTAYYANPAPGIGRFNPAVIQVPVSPGGSVDVESAQPIFLSGVLRDNYFGTMVVRSYPNAVTVAPDGLTYAVSMEASDTVVMVGALDYDRGARTSGFWIAPAPEDDPVRHGFTDHPHASVKVGQGPRGVAFTSDQDAWVHSFMDLTVTGMDAKAAARKVAQRGVNGLQDDESFDNAFSTTYEVEASILPRDVQLGRRLFYSATAPELVASNSGVSCSTCHYDSRDDGLSWQLGPNLRQTPSLAGRVSDTHPVTWTNDVSDVATEAELTSTIRMGGFSASQEDYDMMAAFIDWSREVDHPARGLNDTLVTEGRAIFEREDVGCASCHNGVAFTDNQHHDMFGLERVNTPPLRGIAATGPYLHDGRAGTIREVLELSRNGSMGNTSTLSDAEMDALEAYVQSL